MLVLPNGVIYIFDTSVWITVRRACAPDIFVKLWESIADGIACGGIRCPELVLNEVERNATDDLGAILRGHPDLFLPLSVELQTALAGVLSVGADLVDPTGVSDRADPYLIALAQVVGGTVVTQETPKKLGRQT